MLQWKVSYDAKLATTTWRVSYPDGDSGRIILRTDSHFRWDYYGDRSEQTGVLDTFPQSLEALCVARAREA